MSLLLQAILALTSLAFLWFVLHMVRIKRFLLRYSFLWLLLGVLGLLAALFPSWVYALSAFFGFEAPVNFLFFVCIVVLMAVSLALCAIVSHQSVRMKGLVQEVSLLRQEVSCLMREGCASVDGGCESDVGCEHSQVTGKALGGSASTGRSANID